MRVKKKVVAPWIPKLISQYCAEIRWYNKFLSAYLKIKVIIVTTNHNLKNINLLEGFFFSFATKKRYIIHAQNPSRTWQKTSNNCGQHCFITTTKNPTSWPTSTVRCTSREILDKLDFHHYCKHHQPALINHLDCNGPRPDCGASVGTSPRCNPHNAPEPRLLGANALLIHGRYLSKIIYIPGIYFPPPSTLSGWWLKIASLPDS